MNTQPTNIQKILAKLLLGIFLLESCTTNLPITPQPRPEKQVKRFLTNLPLQPNHTMGLSGVKEVNQDKVEKHEQALVEFPNVTISNTHPSPSIHTTTIDNNNLKESFLQPNYSTRPTLRTPNPASKRFATKQPFKQESAYSKEVKHMSNHQALVANRKAAAIKRMAEQPISVSEQAKEIITNQVFIAQGGHQVRFGQHKERQWYALVEENLPVGFHRSHKLSVIVTPGIHMEQLAKMSQGQQTQLIHVVWPKVGNDIPVSHVLIGYQQGLLGGGKGRNKKHKEVKIEEIKKVAKKKEKVTENSTEDLEAEAKESGEEEETEQPAPKSATLPTAAHLPKAFIKTLWQVGEEPGEEHYRDKSLELLGLKTIKKGEPKLIRGYLKKLGTLGCIQKIVASNQAALPTVWRDKPAEELEAILRDLYTHALGKIECQLTNLSEAEQASQRLAMLELQYYFQRLLDPTSKEQTDLIENIQNAIDELGLYFMPEASVVRRAYLDYLVNEARNMDLYRNTSHINEYIQKVAEIAKLAQDKVEESPEERVVLRRFAGKLYHQIGDLSAKLKNANDIGKSIGWQYSYYFQASTLGNVNAYYKLSLIHADSNTCYYDPRKAKLNLEEAKRRGHGLAGYQLAQTYEKSGNKKLAISWYERAALEGHPAALYQLYENLKDTDDRIKGLKYLGQAALAGHGAAQYALAKHYWDNAHYEAAIHWFNQAAYQGILESYAYLGLSAAKGLGHLQDAQAALDYYLRAEKAGVDNAVARYGRARLYERGKGSIVQDLGTALTLYSQASELGYPKASYHAGRLHLGGQAPGSEVKQAYGLLNVAAKAGIYKACLLLGKINEYGLGKLVDIPAAITWYIQASSTLNKDNYTRALALYHIGWLYKLGKSKEAAEAANLDFFEQAARVAKDQYVNIQSDYEALADQLQAYQDKLRTTASKLKQTKQIVVEKEQAYQQLQEGYEAKIKELEEAHQQAVKAAEASTKTIQAQLAQEEKACRELQEEKALQQQSLSEQTEKNSRLKEEIETAKATTKLVQQQLFEKEHDYQQIPENYEARIKELEEAHQQTIKTTEANTKDIQAQLIQREQAYRKLKEEYRAKLAQQETTFQQEREGKLVIEPHCIKEIMQLVANDKDKLEKVTKMLIPNGKMIVDELAKHGTSFYSSTKNFTELDMTFLVQHPDFQQLTCISLGHTKLNTASYKILGEHLKNVPHLKILLLGGNQPGVAGMQALAPHLKELTNLQNLDLHCNQLGPAEIKVLAPHLKKLISLEKLHLTHNQLSAEGIEALIPHLKEVINLEELHISFNQLYNDEIAIRLAGNLKGSKVKKVYMYSNGITQGTQKEIERLLPKMCWYF